MVKTFEAAAEIVKGIISREYPQVRRAWIFGSFSDASQTDQSDLDIMVEMDMTMGLAFISLIQDLEDAADIRVYVITTEQAHDLESKHGYIITRKAVPVYERTA